LLGIKIAVSLRSECHQISNQSNFQLMGKGDKKTRRGKIMAGSYGKYRAHKVKYSTAPKAETTDAAQANA